MENSGVFEPFPRLLKREYNANATRTAEEKCSVGTKEHYLRNGPSTPPVPARRRYVIALGCDKIHALRRR